MKDELEEGIEPTLLLFSFFILPPSSLLRQVPLEQRDLFIAHLSPAEVKLLQVLEPSQRREVAHLGLPKRRFSGSTAPQTLRHLVVSASRVDWVNDHRERFTGPKVTDNMVAGGGRRGRLCSHLL